MGSQGRVLVCSPHRLADYAGFNRLDKQVALVTQPLQQLFFLEKGVEVNQALDVQAHVVVAMNEAETDEGATIVQAHFFLGVLG